MPLTLMMHRVSCVGSGAGMLGTTGAPTVGRIGTGVATWAGALVGLTAVRRLENCSVLRAVAPDETPTSLVDVFETGTIALIDAPAAGSSVAVLNRVDTSTIPVRTQAFTSVIAMIILSVFIYLTEKSS